MWILTVFSSPAKSYVVRNLETDFKRPVIDSLVTNVSVYNDTVYALLENSVFKIAPDGKKSKRVYEPFIFLPYYLKFSVYEIPSSF